MSIFLKQILPKYFTAANTAPSDIWLKEVEFTTGQHIQIIAPSGNGKTSLIHFIYGMRSDYDGDIFLNTDSIKTADAEKLSAFRRQEISIVFQDMKLFDGQTVLQNLEIKRQLTNYYPTERIYNMAKRLGIEKNLAAQAMICSYGEQQRIAVIRALLQPFKFLLLDEPFSHLDEDNRKKALQLILEECEKRNAAIILADLQKVADFPADEFMYL